MSDAPRATVREVDGKLVLDDPVARMVGRGLDKEACRIFLEGQQDRLAHFLGRIDELGRKPEDVVIVFLHVDDPNGGALADVLMPGVDWQPIRDRGELPVARGLASRDVTDAIAILDKPAANRARELRYPVVVMDRGVVAVFDAAAPLEGQVSP